MLVPFEPRRAKNVAIPSIHAVFVRNPCARGHPCGPSCRHGPVPFCATWAKADLNKIQGRSAPRQARDRLPDQLTKSFDAVILHVATGRAKHLPLRPALRGGTSGVWTFFSGVVAFLDSRIDGGCSPAGCQRPARKNAVRTAVQSPHQRAKSRALCSLMRNVTGSSKALTSPTHLTGISTPSR